MVHEEAAFDYLKQNVENSVKSRGRKYVVLSRKRKFLQRILLTVKTKSKFWRIPKEVKEKGKLWRIL